MMNLKTAVCCCACLPLLLSAVPQKDVQTGKKPGNEPVIKKLSADEYADPVKAAILIERRNEHLVKMHRTRMELIKKDRRLLEIRQKIVRLVRELSLEVNAKKEMYELNKELAELDSLINALPRKEKSENQKEDVKNIKNIPEKGVTK